MAQPTQYARQTSFALFTAENPGEPHSGVSLDEEFSAVKVSLDETQANLALIQDDDGALARGSVGRAQLDSSVTLGVAPPDLWATATDYDADVSVVFRDLVLYLCLVDHTSGTFSTDLAAGYWQVLADFSATAAISDGGITTEKLDDEAVTSAKLASNAVTTVKIPTGAVTTPKIADAAVTTAKIATGGVETSNLADSSATTAKIADGNVTAVKLASDAVTTAKILDANVTTAKIADVAITAAKIADAAITAAKIAGNAVTAAHLPAGAIVQSKYTEYTTNAAFTTIIPFDDTIPQVGEGTEIVTLSFTPSAATNKLRIRFQGPVSMNIGDFAVCALFIGAATDAAAASSIHISAADQARVFNLEYEVVAGGTTAVNYAIRVGPASAGTLRMNGISSARRLGGVSRATLVIEEIKV